MPAVSGGFQQAATLLGGLRSARRAGQMFGVDSFSPGASYGSLARQLSMGRYHVVGTAYACIGCTETQLLLYLLYLARRVVPSSPTGSDKIADSAFALPGDIAVQQRSQTAIRLFLRNSTPASQGEQHLWSTAWDHRSSLEGVEGV